MEYKQFEMLSDYLITKDGNVIELDTMQQVDLQHDPVRKHILNYKLLTDEKVHLEIKQKTIRLWRRFTVDDIVSMYKSPRATTYKDATVDNKVNATESVAKGIKVDPNATNIPDEFPRPYVIVANVAYKNSRSAAVATGEHHTTVFRKCKLNKDGYYLMD